MIVCSQLGRTGRLGNQLWQVAATIGMAHARHDTFSFPQWDYQPYFSVPDIYFSDAPGTEASDLVFHMPASAKPYLQDYSLFAEIEDKIREWLQPSPVAVNAIESCHEFLGLPRPLLSLHVRRGDNVPGADRGVADKHLYHPMPPLSYYMRGAETYLHGGDHYNSVACFSDDIDWCRDNITADYYHVGEPRAKEHTPEYHDPFNDWLDLFLMARCQHHVVPNSTYGWWGAFLAADPDPIVPRPWFGPRIDADADLMFPKGWRQLEREPQC